MMIVAERGRHAAASARILDEQSRCDDPLLEQHHEEHGAGGHNDTNIV